MNANAKATTRAINKILRTNARDERVQCGEKGYYYFYDGEAFSWHSSSVMSYLSHSTVGQVIAEFNELAGTTIKVQS